MNRSDIMMIHGTDYKAMTIRLLTEAGLSDMIGKKDSRIALKPNLVVAAKADRGAVTHPEIVDGVITYLKKHGFSSIRVMEGSWVGARTVPAAKESGIWDVCARHGVPFIDLQSDSFHEVDAAGMTLKVCDEVRSTDFLINLPVIKGHCQTAMTCSLKNLKGLIPNSEKRRFHTMGLHNPIGHLGAAIHQDFIVVDNICGDLDFEEGGNPVRMDRILCCADPVLCDSFACRTMGLSTSDVDYIGIAESLNVGSSDLEKANIISLNECSVSGQVRASGRVSSLAAHADARDACSACYGMLIHALDKLDRQGMLKKGMPKIAIGQGWRGKSGEIGVGACTSCFKKSLKGCPPSAQDMIEFLSENL